MLVLGGLGAGAAYMSTGGPGPDKDLVLEKVKREVLDQTIVERGTLESQENYEVVCKVKAGTKNSTVATTIKELHVEDGDKVKTGQLLITLDSSGLEDQYKTQSITRDNAKLAWDQAEGDLIIQRLQNDSDLQAAKTTLALAEIDLEKYIKAEYPAAEEDVRNRLEQAKDREAYSNRMVKKGYVSASQAEADKFARMKVDKDYETLKYTYKRTIADLQSKLAEAKRNLQRVEEQTKTKENSAVTKRNATKGVYEQEQKRLDEISDEIKKCKVYSERDGIVVYVVPEQARWGGGSQQSIVAQGEPVREGQKLMRIPDLDHMQVNIRVHEALVASVHQGQRARIRVDTFPDKVLHGTVSRVATVDSKQDFMTADVKVYQTIITIDEAFPGLKPGMSCEVTILIARTPGPVLTVPVQAIVDPLESGKRPTVFVVNDDDEVEEREIEVGLVNDKKAQNERKAWVKEGLREGERVVLNPSKLLKGKQRDRLSGAKKDRNKGGEFGPGKAPAKKGKPGKDKAGGPAKKGPPAGGSADRAQQMQRFLKATPAERKQMLQQIPAEFREKAKQALKAQGLQVDD